MFLISEIDTVPPFLFEPLKRERESSSIDWDVVALKNKRSSMPVFSSSRSASLRTHASDASFDVLDNTVECVDTPLRCCFPFTGLVVQWMYRKAKGQRLGRIQLVNLAPLGEVGLHIDPGRYFRTYRRFHVPIVTNPGVRFSNGVEEAHMKAGVMYRLWNIDLHGVRNDSSLERIHLIVDIQVGNDQWS